MQSNPKRMGVMLQKMLQKNPLMLQKMLQKN